MPRRPRLALPGVPLHLIQRGNNRQDCFFTDEDRLFYLDGLAELAPQTGCAIHAYVLMDNHVHLLLTPESAESAGQLMKRLGQRYVQHVNRTQGRSGTLWEGRFRSCLVQEEAYLLTCMRYIELNPVRAGLVRGPGDYAWSSYGANARGKSATDGGAALVTPHALWRRLGRSAEARRKAYRQLFRGRLAGDTLEALRGATNGNYALGDQRFQKACAKALGQRVAPGQPGRPRKTAKASAKIGGR